MSIRLLTAAFTLAICFSVNASNYKLQMSEVFQSCDFIHEDNYSLKSISNAIQGQLQTKLDSDKECNTSFNELNSSLNLIDSILDTTVDPTLAQNIYNETYSSYLVNVTQEASILDLNNPDEKLRYDTLLMQIDSLQSQLQENRYSLELNKEVYSSDISSNFKKNLFNYSKNLFTSLNNMPDKCVNKLGGWGQVVPAILRVGSMIGSTMGPTGMIVGAGLEAASQLTILLQNTRLKKAVAAIDRRSNEQILACTYLSLQTTACDLQRAKKFSENKKKVKEIIFRKFDNSKNKEYEEFYTALNTLPRIREILNSIGEMGSAITLDVDLITQYFKSVRIRPHDIVFPQPDATPAEIKKFLLEMKNKGLEINEFNFNTGQPVPLKEQLESAKVQRDLALSVIDSVISILQEKRSFLDLLAELTIKSSSIKEEIESLETFLDKYPKIDGFPKQYKGLFKAAEKMTTSLKNFLGVSLGDLTYENYVIEVENKGRELFSSMSYGSVAQLTTQTALMIPSIAFERFSRPFKALENYYLQNDILLKDDPTHVSFSNYMINESLQIKVINDYKYLTGSKVSFRLDQYETTKKSFEKGFKREIKRMIKDAMKSQSDVLSSFEGVTAAHMCALFSPFLKENSRKLHQKCKDNYKTLNLLSVLDDFKKKSSMKIDYNNSCFYSNYKREEIGQRILFDRLLDYGVTHK